MHLEGFKPIGEILQAGVYALIWGGKVVYIGKSRRMLVRIYTHRNNWGKNHKKWTGLNWTKVKGILFDDVHIMPCRLEVLDQLEEEMIKLYRPKYNVHLKGPTEPVMVTEPFALQIGGVSLTLGAKPKSEPTLIERRI